MDGTVERDDACIGGSAASALLPRSAGRGGKSPARLTIVDVERETTWRAPCVTLTDCSAMSGKLVSSVSM